MSHYVKINITIDPSLIPAYLQTLAIWWVVYVGRNKAIMEVDVAKAGECFTPNHHQFVLYVVPPRPECAPGETEQQTICHHPIVFRVVNTGHIWTRLKESSCRPCHLALFVNRGNGVIFFSAKKRRIFHLVCHNWTQQQCPYCQNGPNVQFYTLHHILEHKPSLFRDTSSFSHRPRCRRWAAEVEGPIRRKRPTWRRGRPAWRREAP